jgi:hypothetical protein
VWTWDADAFPYQLSDRTRYLAHISYAPGDRLWVRETYMVSPSGHGPTTIYYRADEGYQDIDLVGRPDLIAQADRLWTDPDVWRPSMHMPRWASRITLLVDAVRVERLLAISEDDALAEEIHGVGSWGENPWVTVTTFRPVLANIDEAGETP